MGDSLPQEPSGSGRDSGAAFEIRFYEDVLSRKPDYVEVLMLLGNLYTGQKMYVDGLRVDQRLASLRRDDPIVHYNLACSFSLLGQIENAFAALRQAVELGYNDIDHMGEDADLDRIRSDPRYEQVIEQIRRAHAAASPQSDA
jgi:tetratricopeptide (TPR) repeat protein